MTWSVDETIGEHYQGIFGFILYGEAGILESVDPYFEAGSGEVYTNQEIKRIVFSNDDSTDGIYLIINVTKNGEKLNYLCSNCQSSSPSMELGRLYIDGDMNGKMDFPGMAQCRKSCEFIQGNSIIILFSFYFFFSSFYLISFFRR
mgnify:CR=1 FL=1